MVFPKTNVLRYCVFRCLFGLALITGMERVVAETLEQMLKAKVFEFETQMQGAFS